MLQESERMIPGRAECLRMLEDNGVPPNIIAHSKKVAEVALGLARKINANGGNVDMALLEAAALLHDITKHLGFGKPVKDYVHGATGAEMLRGMGFGEIADVVEAHTLNVLLKPGALDTWEKKLLCYADARTKHDRVVSLRERMEYLMARYPDAAATFKKAEPIVRALEKDIMEKSGDAQ